MVSRGCASRHRRVIDATVLLLVAAAFLAGCNGDGGGGRAPTATPTASPTATPTLPPPTPVPQPAGAGLLSEILDAAVGPGGQIAVTFTLTDAEGIPLQPVTAAAQNDQQARVRFTVAQVENYSGGGEIPAEFTRYVNQLDPVRPRYDRNGVLVTVDPTAGVYRYEFGEPLPDGYDAAATFTVGLQVDRTYAGEQLGVDPVFDFVPAGGTPQIFAGSTTAQCNTCHDPLRLHGNRLEFRLCTLCHTQAATDEKGVSIDMAVFIHKIHRGKDLPSIVNGPPGATYAIYSSFAREEVVFAEKLDDGTVIGVGFPRSLEDCAICHTGGATSEYYRTRPAAAPCTGCHDDVNPSQVATEAGPPGTNHFGIGFPDSDCRSCHRAEQGVEFDITVPGAHVIPEQSQQLAGLVVDITGVASHEAGDTPIVSFKVTDNAGAALRDLSGLNRVAFALAGPTLDYATLFTPTAVGGGASGTLTGPDPDGVFQYTLPAPLPADAYGTWSIGAEARRSVQLSTPGGGPITVNEAAVNPVVTFTVDDSAPLARRVVVEDANCQRCHGEFSRGFSIHGNLRNRVEYCDLCHNPNNSDVSRRQRDPAAVARGEAVAPIDFKVMIHKIHTGDELAQKPYLIYGFGPPPANYSIIDFAEVRYPGDRRDCVKCHAPDTYLLPPFPGTALGTQIGHLDPETGNEIVDGRLGPIRSVCTACHDNEAAVAHAETQTAPDGAEACVVCHAEGRDFAVSAVHAR